MGKVKQPKNLTPRIEWLRNYFFEGVSRPWNNEYKVFTTGEEHDEMYNELTYYIVPETYTFFGTFQNGLPQIARRIEIPDCFYGWSIAERRAWFVKEAMTKHVPLDILPGDLLCGANFNIFTSQCLTKKEKKRRDKALYGKDGLRAETIEFHDRGFGNCGATSGHLIPDYATILSKGFKYVIEQLDTSYESLSEKQRKGAAGAQLRAMKTAAEMPCELAKRYAARLKILAANEKDRVRKAELIQMSLNLEVVPFNPARDLWQAVQSLWLTHMLVMSDENYPGPGVSFGRLDQYLYPYYLKSVDQGMTEEFMKEILECMWVHCNTVYDAQIKVGANQGITAGFGQLFMISGIGDKGQDMTNELSYMLLDVIDDMSPILEPKPNVRLHKNSPDKLLKRIVEMIAESQGAPFLLNFDERSMAGLLREAKKSGCEDKINASNVWNYASVGCMENSMVGNDRSSTVDINLNLLKAVELTLVRGGELREYKDMLWNKPYPPKKHSEDTGDPTKFATFEEFYAAFEKHIRYIVRKIAELYDKSDCVRADFQPTPYLSLLIKGCIEKALDVTQGGAELRFITVEGVTFASTVDSLLAVKYLVYDKKVCTMAELIEALKNNWEGNEKLQAIAKNKAPKYGRDDDDADEMARKVMELWAEETWKYKTAATDAQLRPGMLSWNYWVGDGYVLPASPDGRKNGQFLSNAVCPCNGADTKGPTSNINSVGKALGGRTENGDYMDYINYLPNGASHTITLSPSLVRDDAHKDKLAAFLKAYTENGGTALQINILDVDTLIDAQKHPAEYRHLLVRVTGYNAYFTSIGRELQNEIIAREIHNKF
ncbi:MAG: pyruvate formate lyase family protein [Clostridia bacterium]|nr:pyruvate formate lyase family protein [Clostridia bacterium]